MAFENDGKSNKKRAVIWIVIILLILAVGGIGAYAIKRNKQNKEQQSKYDKMKEDAFVKNVTPTQAVTSTPVVKPTEAPSPAPTGEITPDPTETPATPTPEPTAVPLSPEELLYRALMEEYPSYITITADFNVLHNINKDIIAYIEIPDSDIAYPILQSGPDKADDYYLKHNLDGSEGYPSCIYIQKANSNTLDDKFTVVYGHNMKNGTMFGSLKNFKNEDFRLSHPYFFVYTEDRILVYEVCVVSNIETTHLLADDYKKIDGKLRFDRFSGRETSRMLERVNNEGKDEAYIAQPAPANEDTVMVLSTCGDGRRYIVAGKRVLEISFGSDDTTE